MADDIDSVRVDLVDDGPVGATAAKADLVEPEAGAPAATVTLPPHAVALDDGTVRLPLRFPVTLRIQKGSDVREETVSELHFHRLTGADMRAVMSAGKNAGVVSIARATRIPQHRFDAIYDRMDGADIYAADKVVDFFLSPGQPSGR